MSRKMSWREGGDYTIRHQWAVPDFSLHLLLRYLVEALESGRPLRGAGQAPQLLEVPVLTLGGDRHILLRRRVRRACPEGLLRAGRSDTCPPAHRDGLQYYDGGGGEGDYGRLSGDGAGRQDRAALDQGRPQ